MGHASVVYRARAGGPCTYPSWKVRAPMLRFAGRQIPCPRGSAGRRHHLFTRHHHLLKHAHCPGISYDPSVVIPQILLHLKWIWKALGIIDFFLFLKEGSAMCVRVCLCVTRAIWPRSYAGGGCCRCVRQSAARLHYRVSEGLCWSAFCANTVTDRVDSFDLIHKQRAEVKFRVRWGSVSFCGFKITVRAPTSSLCWQSLVQ